MQQIWLSVTEEQLRSIIQECVRTELHGQSQAPTQVAAEGEEFLTTKQTCSFLKISHVTLLKWRREGLVAAHMFGKSVRFLKSDLLKVSQIRSIKKNGLQKVQ